MTLDLLQADRIRCLRAVSLEPSRGLTLLHGRNGQGKTTLLEAAYLLATGRSFRTPRIEEAVRRGGGPLRVAGRVSGRAGETDLAVVVDGGARRLAADGAEVGLEAYLGRLEALVLSAERERVLRGGPEERRRFLDRGIAGLAPAYLRTLGECRRALEQRNALLRSGGAGRRAEVEAWDERLAAAAAAVHRRRREYAVRLAAALAEPARAVFGPGETLTVAYRPSPAAAGEAGPRGFEDAYRRALRSGASRDGALGFTGEGPHRDDLLLELEGRDLRKYGSAGQVRAAVIALKLGKLRLYREERGENPVLLMDDFDADLDEERAGRVAGFLQEESVQAMLTTSKETLAGALGVPMRKVRVVEGETRAA